MAFNFGAGLTGAGTGALAGASLGSVVPGIGNLSGAAVGAIAGGLLGSATGFLGNSTNSAGSMSMEDAYNLQMFNIAKDMYYLDMQNKYNTSNMRYQTDLQKELQQQQFDMNKYFIDNAYQMTTSDMKAAGINPILAAGNSNTGSVGSGSASALSSSLPNSGSVSPSDLMSASASSSQAKTAKAQLALNSLNVLQDMSVKASASAKQIEEAKTNRTVQDLNRYKTLNEAIDSQLKNVELNFKVDSEKSKIINQLWTAKAALLNAEVNDYLKESQKYSNYTSANANMINATTGNPTKVIVDYLNDIFGDDPKKGGKKTYGYIKNKIKSSYHDITDKPDSSNDYKFNDFDKDVLYDLYNALKLNNSGVEFK